MKREALAIQVTGIGATAASSCCILPLALSTAGFGGAWLGGVSELMAYRPWFLAAAALALAAGWIVGTVVAALRCFTPIIVIVLGVVGLSALVGWQDIVLLPLPRSSLESRFTRS